MINGVKKDVSPIKIKTTENLNSPRRTSLTPNPQ